MVSVTTKRGEEIPRIGLGTFPFQGRVMADLVKVAYKVGYKLFDTADDYRGETGIGIAVKELQNEGVSREELFLQTKISDNNAHEDEPLKGIFFNPQSKFMQRHSVEEIVREKVDFSLLHMKTSYLDSLLIHYPFPDYYTEIWKVMIQLREEGLVRYIGVSNFHKNHIETLIKETGVKPDFNQIYISPISSKQEVLDYCSEIGCRPMTYSPLMDLTHNRINKEMLGQIARNHGKSEAQVVLRWNIERGSIPLPKTKTPSRLKENFDVFDFTLSEEEINQLSSLNYDYQYLVETKICPGV